jgi:hypothetical protein
VSRGLRTVSRGRGRKGHGDHQIHGHFWIPIDDENCWVFTCGYHPVRPLGISMRDASLRESMGPIADIGGPLPGGVPASRRVLDTPVSGQTAETAPARVLEFLGSAES